MRSKHVGFTLIELMIVVAIIAIIAGIAIPGILAARRASNEGAAMANLKSFSTAMTTYNQRQKDQTYPTSTNQFAEYYSHMDTKSGYNYYYSSDSKKYVYCAVPTSLNNGTKIFYVDESNRIFEADADSDKGLGRPSINLNANTSEDRISSFDWTKKS